jgi:hypothetical protein
MEQVYLLEEKIATVWYKLIELETRKTRKGYSRWASTSNVEKRSGLRVPGIFRFIYPGVNPSDVFLSPVQTINKYMEPGACWNSCIILFLISVFYYSFKVFRENTGFPQSSTISQLSDYTKVSWSCNLPQYPYQSPSHPPGPVAPGEDHTQDIIVDLNLHIVSVGYHVFILVWLVLVFNGNNSKPKL